jgi:hypothetical protein
MALQTLIINLLLAPDPEDVDDLLFLLDAIHDPPATGQPDP